jgi:hypothetical protein
VEAPGDIATEKAEKISLRKRLVEEVVSFFNKEHILFWLEVLGLTDALAGRITTELLLLLRWLKASSYLMV